MLAKVVQCLPAPNGGGAALTHARVGACVPEISHVIPLRVFQLLKSEHWNPAVCGVLQSPVARELRAELVRIDALTPLCVRRRRAYAARPAAATPRARSSAPGLLRVPGCRVLGLLRCLACCLLGAGVRLDLFGGEGALCGAFAAVGALPRHGEAVARTEARQVDADD